MAKKKAAAPTAPVAGPIPPPEAEVAAEAAEAVANTYGVDAEQWDAWTPEQQYTFNAAYDDEFHANPKQGPRAWARAVDAANALTTKD